METVLSAHNTKQKTVKNDTNAMNTKPNIEEGLFVKFLLEKATPLSKNYQL